jgi:putative tricarboxylic transport membrane protein
MVSLRGFLARIGGYGSDRISGGLLLLLALFVLWQNRAYPVGSLSEPGAGFLPQLLAGGLALVALLIVWRGGNSAALAALGWSEAARPLVIIAACAVATLALEPLGYRTAIMALLVFLLGVIERKPPLYVVLIAAGFTLTTFFVFSNLLGLQLPRSPWGF